MPRCPALESHGNYFHTCLLERYAGLDAGNMQAPRCLRPERVRLLTGRNSIHVLAFLALSFQAASHMSQS